jgi:hypothetical protein
MKGYQFSRGKNQALPKLANNKERLRSAALRQSQEMREMGSLGMWLHFDLA